ncbi:hypothetical protein CC2G_012615 [Coprinopsis cinerea AmutBmut pab1-1]|nr:hypothetical protein CC2G_012615 [Coprinopsis cinerea AmutBmut pab1-1]
MKGLQTSNQRRSCPLLGKTIQRIQNPDILSNARVQYRSRVCSASSSREPLKRPPHTIEAATANRFRRLPKLNNCTKQDLLLTRRRKLLSSQGSSLSR